jgi:hypothetical protein
MRRLLLVLLMVLPTALQAQGGPPGPPLSLRFREQVYERRWSGPHQHEFTPAGQEDLSRWTDMVTINTYPQVRDGDGLAEVANRVLATYTSNNGRVLRTASVPRSAAGPAEHLIVALFPRPESIEAVFARFRLADGRGTAVIVSHRIHGRAAGPAMQAWLEANGPDVERRLMALEGIPSPRLLEPGGP